MNDSTPRKAIDVVAGKFARKFYRERLPVNILKSFRDNTREKTGAGWCLSS